MSELKPCPFCGGEAHIAENVGYRGDIAYTVNCNAVYGCIASDSGLWYSSREAAVEAWNTRAWTVADNDAEVLGDVTLGLFRDLMAADPETAKLWARSWPELLGEVVSE